MNKEALFYEKAGDKTVHCFLCSHRCRIPEGGFGFCGVRQNQSGTLYSLNYGKVIAGHLDPIEKKPLYHFLPGTESFSIATVGCNFRCGFCQNWQISQETMKAGPGRQEESTPLEIINTAVRSNCRSISYTYTEPTIFIEFALDCATLAKEKGLYNVFVTNGYMTPEALEELAFYLDAANVDLKFFKEASYQDICQARLQPVLESIGKMKQKGIWVEITTLVIPGLNDSKEELGNIAAFIAGLDKDMPWHISRFHPDYKFTDYAITPEAILDKAYEIGKTAGLRYVYTGNVAGRENNTYCPACKKLLIRRRIFEVLENKVQEDKCVYCKNTIAGLFVG
ncbi:MAG: AmmeMemoRadiSam system radical SAM enzyme [Candidatus Omnitrophica bacterium]|nr:AmmeMemoRadiSam system radical SAM enzyme [Candidatus Omnitrophota bacterium]